MVILVLLIYIIIGSLCSATVYAYNCKRYKDMLADPNSEVSRYNMSWNKYSYDNEISVLCGLILFFWIVAIPIFAIIFIISYIQKEIKNYYGIK